MYPQEYLTNHCEKCNLVHHPQTPCDEHAQLMYKVQQRAQWIITSEEIARIRAEALKEAFAKFKALFCSECHKCEEDQDGEPCVMDAECDYMQGYRQAILGETKGESNT